MKTGKAADGPVLRGRCRLHLKPVELEIPIRYSNGDGEQAVGYVSQEFKKEI